MNARDDLERLVPRLRRYARAVLGDAGAADRCVGDALAEIAAAPPPPDALTLAGFRRVDAVLRSAPGSGAAADTALGDLDALDHEVHELADLDRHVLLLNGLERFEPADIARIVERTEAEVTARLEAAYAALEGERRARVLVCRGDPARGEPLDAVVRDAGHEVAGTASDGREAIRLVRETAADLLFADLDCASHAPCPAALDAVRALHDVGCVAVTDGADEAIARLADTAVVVVSKPVDARLLTVAFAHALRSAARPGALR